MGSLDFFPLRVDETEESGSLVLSLTMPGLDPEQDVEVTVADRALEVCVERFEETTADEGGVARTERHFGSYRRSVPLPEGTDADDVTASYSDGVLAIRVPMSEGLPQPRVRHIPVQTGPVEVPVERRRSAHRWSLKRKKPAPETLRTETEGPTLKQ
jgi:HSP20 family protein